MKRTSTLLALVLLLAGAAAGRPAPLPDDARFDQPVAFSTGPEGESLAAMVAALARSVGLTPVVDGVPDVDIRYDIGDPKPFRQVWDLVLTLNDLDYLLQPNDVVVVGTEASLAALRAGEGPAGDAPERVQRFYRLRTTASEMVEILRTALPGLEVQALTEDTLVVVADAEGHARASELLAEFDVPAERVRLVQRVYRLNNARAAELAAVLQASDVVVEGASAPAGGEAEGTAGTATADAGADAATDATDAEVAAGFTVVPDERTNALVVTAPPPVQARIAELIPELDTPQRQVNVQVRIQEINRRAASNLGIDITGAGGNFAATLLGGGLEFVFDAQSAVSGLNLGAVLDTLETQGLSRRVDDANLTVLSNGTGRIQSGGRIEIQYPSGEGGELATRTIEYGVIVEITPRVASDGRVILDVLAEVSDVLVPLGDGGIPERIDFSTREVTSTVTLRPGQTVLLGGLLQNTFSRTRQSVPILGQLPLIGGLFGTTDLEHENSELLLVVNASVVE